MDLCGPTSTDKHIAIRMNRISLLIHLETKSISVRGTGAHFVTDRPTFVGSNRETSQTRRIEKFSSPSFAFIAIITFRSFDTFLFQNFSFFRMWVILKSWLISIKSRNNEKIFKQYFGKLLKNIFFFFFSLLLDCKLILINENIGPRWWINRL